MKPDKCRVGIVGVGMVGGALARYFESVGVQPRLYDKFNKIGSPKEVNKADIIFICVPTPHHPHKGFDLTAVKEAFRLIKGRKIVVIKSTVLPGTTEFFQKKYPRHKVLFNPEFLVEATADQDMKFPDRQIVGHTQKSYGVALSVMQLLPLAPLERLMTATEAEMVKYFGNSFLAVKVIFANQIYDLCQAQGLNYDLVKECAAADKRIGRAHLDVLRDGYRGYSGKCLPKDIRALIQHGERLGIDLELLKAAERVNNKLIAQNEHNKDH